LPLYYNLQLLVEMPSIKQKALILRDCGFNK